MAVRSLRVGDAPEGLRAVEGAAAHDAARVVEQLAAAREARQEVERVFGVGYLQKLVDRGVVQRAGNSGAGQEGVRRGRVVGAHRELVAVEPVALETAHKPLDRHSAKAGIEDLLAGDDFHQKELIL